MACFRDSISAVSLILRQIFIIIIIGGVVVIVYFFQFKERKH